VSATRSPRRLLTVLLVAVALVAGGACGGSPTGSPSAPPPAGSGDLPSHARLVATRHVSGRMWDLTVDSPAVGEPHDRSLVLSNVTESTTVTVRGGPPRFDRYKQRPLLSERIFNA
jgi:hypothetical protein